MQWVTRERPKVDRIACPWLIRRFVDPEAEFVYVPVEQVLTVAEQTGAVPYDVPQGSSSAIMGRNAPSTPSSRNTTSATPPCCVLPGSCAAPTRRIRTSRRSRVVWKPSRTAFAIFMMTITSNSPPSRSSTTRSTPTASSRWRRRARGAAVAYALWSIRSSPDDRDPSPSRRARQPLAQGDVRRWIRGLKRKV
jgi:hypothetical protein